MVNKLEPTYTFTDSVKLPFPHIFTNAAYCQSFNFLTLSHVGCRNPLLGTAQGMACVSINFFFSFLFHIFSIMFPESSYSLK